MVARLSRPGRRGGRKLEKVAHCDRLAVALRRRERRDRALSSDVATGHAHTRGSVCIYYVIKLKVDKA